MAIIQFGHTWWGGKWLNALNHIDYSNRLPRGQRYARNGSVSSIDIDNNKIMARVQGRQVRPYRVTMELPGFSKKQQDRIAELIRSTPYYLAKFEARVLPEDLYAELTDLDIKLFPSSWKDMQMHCSCPDWAVPCKHIAAVIYIIANEIDKNPFIIFNLRNFDLLQLFLDAGKTEAEEIISIDSLLAYKPKACTYYQEKLEAIDFTSIPDLLPPVMKLLTERPLFYLKNDFKAILLQHYKRMQKAVKKHIRETDLSEELPGHLYTAAEFRIMKSQYNFKGHLKDKETLLPFARDDMQGLIDYLQVLTLGDLNTYPPVVAFLITVHSFVLMLIKKSAYIPDILVLKKGVYIIRWIPALFNREIETIFTALVEAIPSNILKYGAAPLSRKEQVLFLVSFFISYYLALFTPVKDLAGDEILGLFFAAGEYVPRAFEQQETAKTIHLWLGRFFIHPKNCHPVIKIEEGADEKSFLFEVLVKDKRLSITETSSLREFLASENDEKFPLLKDLSLLSTYLPVVNRVLRTQQQVTVSPDSFVGIWFEALPVLKTLGIETLLPRALKDIFMPALTLGLKKKKKMEGPNIVSYMSLEQLLNFNWSIALGDRFISPGEFRKLAARYSGIVKFKDCYIYLDQKEMAKIIKQLEKNPQLDAMDLLKVHLTGTYKDVPVQREKKLKKLLDDLFRPAAADLPAGLKAVLREYQLAGYRWLYHNSKIGLGSLIADDMGLGKTIQVITLLLKFREEKLLHPGKQALAVVPATLLTNWQREAARFAPVLQTSVYHGPQRELDKTADLIITTYSLVRGDLETLKKKKWLCVIIDEAQNIKNPAASQTKAAKALRAEIKIAMTGTPVENKLMDYWSILDFIMKNLPGSQTAFKEAFAVPIERFRDQQALGSFRALTAPFILRRVKTDKSIIRDLPEKIRLNRYVELTGEQAALYQGLVDRIDELEKTEDEMTRRGLIFKLIIGLKQICNHPALYLKEKRGAGKHSGKSRLLTELVEKCLDRNEKMIIFSQFTQMGHLLEQILESDLGLSPLFLHGGLTRKKRDEIVDSFQNDLAVKVLLLSLKAGGTGLNLTAANNVVHYDLWWNPAVENQATDRAFRIGQKRNVNVYRLITVNTFEEKINAMLENKQELADLTVNVGEKWITEMSNQELKELLRLER